MEVDVVLNEEKCFVKFCYFVLFEEIRGIFLGCLEFDENISLFFDFEGFLFFEFIILLKF